MLLDNVSKGPTAVNNPAYKIHDGVARLHELYDVTTRVEEILILYIHPDKIPLSIRSECFEYLC